MDSSARVKIALFGLGRLGAKRALILSHSCPRMELVAVCDTKPGCQEWAATNLPATVRFFEVPEDCLLQSGAQAVLISTATVNHAPIVLRALDLGLVSYLGLVPCSRESLACHGGEAYRSRYGNDTSGDRQGETEATPQVFGTILSTV